MKVHSLAMPSPHDMLKKGPFLRKFGFSLKDYASTGLRWSDLVAIFEDYCGRYAFLQKAADSMMGQISECPQVHAAKEASEEAGAADREDRPQVD